MNKKSPVLLDLGGVVFGSTGKTSPSIDWSVVSALNNVYGHDLNVGKDRFPDFLSSYNQRTGQSLSGSDFLREIFDTLSINQALIDFLLSRYRIFIVSDNYRENIQYIRERYHFADWAEREFYSFEMKMVKTDPGFFPALVQNIPEPPEDLLFIDDSPEKIKSAAASGIQSILYRNNQQTIDAIRALQP